MERIADKNGVDVIIAPVLEKDGLQVNLDFNYGIEKMYELDRRCRSWDLKFMDGKHHVGSAKFTAYQFLCDGIERRTIALKSISVEPRHRGQKKSYDVAQFVIDTVTTTCDREWGEVGTSPVLFVEKKDFAHLPEKERNGFFEFLKKVGEKILGIPSHNQPSSNELTVSVIGDQITMQLIQEHLLRSNSEATKGDPRHDGK